MPSTTYRLTEPHPSIPKNNYAHSGRGGAGNLFKAPLTTPPRTAGGPPSLLPLPPTSLPPTSSSSAKFSSGRGGAGNIKPSSQRVIYSFDEELERQATREQKDGVWHVGRGGAGNWTSKKIEGERKTSTSSDASSVRSGFLGRLSSGFERR